MNSSIRYSKGPAPNIAWALVAVLLFAGIASAADVNLTTQTTVNVQDLSTTVSARASRRFIILHNASDVTIYCKFGATALVGEGLTLLAAGGFIFDDVVPTGELNCVTDSGTDKPVTLSEGG